MQKKGYNAHKDHADSNTNGSHVSGSDAATVRHCNGPSFNRLKQNQQARRVQFREPFTQRRFKSNISSSAATVQDTAVRAQHHCKAATVRALGLFKLNGLRSTILGPRAQATSPSNEPKQRAKLKHDNPAQAQQPSSSITSQGRGVYRQRSPRHFGIGRRGSINLSFFDGLGAYRAFHLYVGPSIKKKHFCVYQTL
jgi:hypothetical protein